MELLAPISWVKTGTVQDVKLARKGDHGAFARLIKSNQASIYRTAKAILGTDSDCADAIQEAIKFYYNIEKLKNDHHFKTWLIKIVINESRRLLKNNRKFIAVESPLDLQRSAEHESKEIERVEIQEIVGSLKEELRIIVALYYYEDLPLKDISRILEIPVGTVKSRLSRARSILFESLKIRED